MNAEVRDVLFGVVAAFLVIIVFIGADEHLEVLNLPRWLQSFEQIFDLTDFGKHIDHLRKNLLVTSVRLLLWVLKILGDFWNSTRLLRLIFSFKTLVAR